MGPENPLWVKMYAEEMAKRNTAQTTAVIKKWLKEE
jgi:flagellar biosynthesis/type III secretory pathway M-ring protein FliF/YscJ